MPDLTFDHMAIVMDDFRLTADWSVGQGARVAVLGPSGAGKSTLLMALAGFVTPVSGAIRWDGQDLARTPPDRRPVTMLFQDQNLFPHLTVAQNVGLGISPRLKLSPADHARMAGVLARVGLAGMEARRPAQLSGGQQGRAALARALLRDRPVLLLDEPFAALGPALKAEMLDLVLETSVGKTVLMVTHAPADARRMGGDTVVVADGMAHPPMPTEGLLADPPPALRAYLG